MLCKLADCECGMNVKVIICGSEKPEQLAETGYQDSMSRAQPDIAEHWGINPPEDCCAVLQVLAAPERLAICSHIRGRSRGCALTRQYSTQLFHNSCR